MSGQSQARCVSQFQCLGDACRDGCCAGWGMQVDGGTLKRYQDKAPELLEFVTSGEAEHIMRRDAVTDQCVKLDKGWCSIHRDYGNGLLGDACHYFPRIPRGFGASLTISGALSCPELARLALTGEDAFSFVPYGDGRAPYMVTNFLPEGMSEEEGYAIHAKLIALVDDTTATAEQSLMRLSTISRALDALPVSQWASALPIYMTLADGRIPPAEPNINDPFNLAHGIYGLVQAAGLHRPRLDTIIRRLSEALGIQFEGMGLTLVDDAALRASKLLARCRGGWLQPVLRRYLQAQLSQSLYPFSGFGKTLAERITIIGVRFATVKLALAILDAPTEDTIIDTIQPLSRFLDHLADPKLSLMMYEQTGWAREARLRGLLGA